MPTFEYGNMEGYDQERLLPEGLYKVRLMKPVTRAENKKKTGFNVVIELETFGAVDPELNGFPFTLWLPEPVAGDEHRKTRRGITLAKAKWGRIARFIAALGGEVDPTTGRVDLPTEGLAQAYIIQALDRDNQPICDIQGDLMPITED